MINRRVHRIERHDRDQRRELVEAIRQRIGLRRDEALPVELSGIMRDCLAGRVTLGAVRDALKRWRKNDHRIS